MNTQLLEQACKLPETLQEKPMASFNLMPVLDYCILLAHSPQRAIKQMHLDHLNDAWIMRMATKVRQVSTEVRFLRLRRKIRHQHGTSGEDEWLMMAPSDMLEEQVLQIMYQAGLVQQRGWGKRMFGGYYVTAPIAWKTRRSPETVSVVQRWFINV